MCALDLLKAFDKVNHYAFFSVLIKRGCPLGLVTVLLNWFGKIYTCIRWNNILSTPVQLKSGVGQGSILSPSFIAIFVDGLFDKLEDTRPGCFVNGVCVDAIMYANDLVIMALTVSDLRILLNHCSLFLETIDMPLNFNKSKCIRFGNRHKAPCSDIVINGTPLHWVKSLRYLGVSIQAGVNFCCDFSEARHIFFVSFNTIHGRIGNKQCIPV